MPSEASERIRASRGAPPEYDGVAELWYDSLESLLAARSPESSVAARDLLEDERKFIDLANPRFGSRRSGQSSLDVRRHSFHGCPNRSRYVTSRIGRRLSGPPLRQADPEE